MGGTVQAKGEYIPPAPCWMTGRLPRLERKFLNKTHPCHFSRQAYLKLDPQATWLKGGKSKAYPKGSLHYSSRAAQLKADPARPLTAQGSADWWCPSCPNQLP